ANIIFFFFQAEDGIRDRNVTGVQTCALPICALGAIFKIQGTPMSAGFGFAGLIGPMTAYEQMDPGVGSMILLTTLFVVLPIILGLAMKYIFVGESKFVKANDLLIETE